MTADLATFVDKLATRLGVPPGTLAELLNQWQPYEGGWTKNNANFNPINTTENMPGASSINSVGVKAYQSLDDGVEATARTLTNGKYGNIMRALHTGVIDASIAPDVRTWTSGQPTGHSNFADLLESKGGGSAESWAGGGSVKNGAAITSDGVTFGGGATTPSDTTTTKPATNAKAALDAATAALNELIQNQPGFDDPAFPGWSTRVDALQKFVNNLTTQAGLRDTTFANTNTQFSDKLSLDTAAQNNAQNSITNFLNGAQESRGRATLNLDAQKLLQTWGTPEGKSSYTPDELGSSFANTYRQAGLDPTRASLNYTGTVRVNPGADLAAGDAQFGAGGALPTLPRLNTSASDIPGLPQSPEWPSAPSPSSPSTGGFTTPYGGPSPDQVERGPDPYPYGGTASPLPGTPQATINQIRDAAGHLFSPAF